MSNRLSEQSIEQKKALFEAFYLINFPTKVNVVSAARDLSDVSMDDFESTMPYVFRIASELSEIEAQALKPLRALGEKLEDLITYLSLQARKIDLMMSYVLQQQDDEKFRATAVKFGGGGIVVTSTSPVNVGTQAEIKIFLEKEAAAVYCYGEALECEKVAEEHYKVSYLYTHIREQDQELLVRASLHLQTAQLRAKDKSE